MNPTFFKNGRKICGERITNIMVFIKHDGAINTNWQFSFKQLRH